MAHRWLLLLLPVRSGAYEGSCAGKCGSWGSDCWCNDQCEARGNCCDDYAQQCGQPSCEKCHRYTCDEWIQWDERNTCESLKKEWGCKCSGCKCAASSGASLVKLQQSVHPEAKCLDGSMAGYYLRRGSEASHFLIFLEGGGWCYDQNCEAPTADGTLEDCRQRSTGKLGSSRSWAATKPDHRLSGMLSADASANPVFHNWTLVYVPYCDGASFTGDSEVDGLHFKGQQILNAVITELETKERLLEARKVVLSGGSAGASAVLFHADALRERLQGVCVATERRRMTENCRQDMEVLALADAGFFLDLPDIKGIRCWPNQIISLFNVSRGYSGLHSDCLERFKSEPWRCLFPQYYADLISTRTFLANSLYDSSELQYTLRLDCSPDGRYQRSCDAQEMARFEELRSAHAAAWRPLAKRPGNGLWAVACVDHTLTWGRWTDPHWQVPEDGAGLAEAVQQWLGGQSVHFEDSVPWPMNRPCSGAEGTGARRSLTGRPSPELPAPQAASYDPTHLLLGAGAAACGLGVLCLLQRRKPSARSPDGLEMEIRCQSSEIDTRRMAVVPSRKSVIPKLGPTLLGVKGSGMPIHQDPFNFGNLFLAICIRFPEGAESAALAQLLGESESEEQEDCEEVFCEAMDPLLSAKQSKKVTTQDSTKHF
ncbi:unnamed protein product [Effrenium voratum]|uniref:SMB domain-containing protein n=1 Tax=Effrenium voratum TaxID=2562239 RepID=A0AA36JB04_9DINO|nr:unnamed protein product [Effrenium voratum]